MKGFTLLEVLVAMAIFAVVSIASYSSLVILQTNDSISQNKTILIKSMQNVLNHMQSDFSQATDRYLKDQNDLNFDFSFRAQEFLYESDSFALEFVRLGWVNPRAKLPRGSLQRVIYLIKDNKLQRHYYSYPDLSSGSIKSEQIILDGVESMTFRYFYEGSWQDDWQHNFLPNGIEITLETLSFGQIKKTVVIPKSQEEF